MVKANILKLASTPSLTASSSQAISSTPVVYGAVPFSQTPSEIIDRILNNNKDAPDFALKILMNDIDNLLSHYQKGKGIASHGTSVAAGLPSASEAFKFSEAVSDSVKLISNQISQTPEANRGTTIRVLNAIGNFHWIGVGFLLVAVVLSRYETIKSNQKECLQLLKSMNELAKIIVQLKRHPHLKTQMQAKMKESIELIVDGTMLCCYQKRRKKFARCYMASKDAEELDELRLQIDEIRNVLTFQINVCILDGVYGIECDIPPAVSCHDDAVGIEQQIDEVIKQLEWDNEKQTVAVVVHGIGGAGKTTLADAVYASLQLQGWKHCKVTLIKNLESEPNIEELQSQILQALTGDKYNVRDHRSGRQKMKEIMESEDSIFIYIDNVLRKEHLEKLLPKKLTNPKKIRMLLTARKTNISKVVEDCRIQPCKIYPMEPLCVDTALRVLCRKIDREKETKSVVDERPQVMEIAKKCSCCPLVLEVVGAYLHKRKNQSEAYERLLNWLECGEAFSGDKEDSFYEERLLFAYEDLQPNAKEAFLDICSFFSGWEWDDVACIVGEEELKSLEEGALVKRKETIENRRKSTRVSIHDLLLAVGRAKSKGLRLTNVDDFSKALDDGEHILCQIKGVWLENGQHTFHVSAKQLEAMSGSLRVFAMGNLTVVNGKCTKQFNELRFLQAGGVPNLPFDINNLKYLSFMDDNSKENVIFSSYKIPSKLKVLKFCKGNGCTEEKLTILLKELGSLQTIKRLDLCGYNITGLPGSLGQLYALQRLSLQCCGGLKELPESLKQLRSLEKLDLSDCSNLKQLPAGFGELGALMELDLSNCCSLHELPSSFEKLASLQVLSLYHCCNLFLLPERLGNLTSLMHLDLQMCMQLSSLPDSFGQLMCLSVQISFEGCKALTGLPEAICNLTMTERLSLRNCYSLKTLPNRFRELRCLNELHLCDCKELSGLPEGFGELSCLQVLVLEGCEILEQLPNDFHSLEALRELNMSGCRSLSMLPQDFDKLTSLEMLILSDCDHLEQLPSDFHSLAALIDLDMSGCNSLSRLPESFGKLSCLKVLNLSECKGLAKLPEGFGKLGCLEELHLSGCSHLEELCGDFHCLQSLKKLDVSHCEMLDGIWMERVGDIQSMLWVDIRGSGMMIQQWMEMQGDKEAEQWPFPVRGLQTTNNLLWKAIISKLFTQEGLLIDTHGYPFYLSSLLPNTCLILVFVINYAWTHISRASFETKVQCWLESNSTDMQIIYIGQDFSTLPTDLGNTIMAYKPHGPQALFLVYNLLHSYDGIDCFRTIVIEENGRKCFSRCEDISYIFHECPTSQEIEEIAILNG